MPISMCVARKRWQGYMANKAHSLKIILIITGFLNGKVVFKFRCHEAKEISWQIGLHELEQQSFSDFLDKCCLGYFELKDYLNKENGYAIHISDLEIFDEPKKLSEFKRKKAPQNFCYVESPKRIRHKKKMLLWGLNYQKIIGLCIR